MRGDDDKVERDEQGHSQSDASPSSRNLTPSSSTCFLDERDMAVLAVEEELSFWQLIRLSLCLAGVQFTCGVPVVVNGAQKLIQSIALKGTVELAYGTPYLLSLGLPKALTALVWIAGPLSGILIQPLVGVYSDRFVCSYGRRRPFMLFGGLLVVCSIALIAYSKEIAHLLLFGNTDNENAAINLTIGIAVSAFYFLDFSINAVQASCRALIVDCAPLSQQQLANAWGGRMIGFGNILGYFMGFLNLPLLFPFLGETQLKVLCALATLWFSGTVLTTCITTHEVPYSRQSTSGPESERRAPSLWDPAREILSAMRYLPSQIQAICNVQFFGWLAWFPFLFYSTSWITSKGHLMGEAGINATRDGSLALLIFALISVLVMFLLPHIRQSPGSPSRSYKGIQWRGLSMAWIWALSFWLFALCLFSTFLSNGPVSAIFIIASCGFSWGVTQWVPFTLMGEFVSDGLSNYEAAGNGVTDGFQRDVESHDPLLSSSSVLFEADSMEKDSPQEALSIASKSSSAHAPPLDAGMALGIHNIYIVLPQFLSTFISSLVFMYTGSLKHGEDGSSTVDEFGWVLRIGATAAIVAGFVALRVEEVPESSRNGKKGLD